MAYCKYPSCGKILVGKEKHLCKSCKDKIKNGAMKVVNGTVAVATVIIAVPKMLPKFKK